MKNFSAKWLLLSVVSCFMSVSSMAQTSAKPTQDPTFIYRLSLLPTYQKEANWTPETNKIVSAHFVRLKEFTDQGVVIMAGRTEYEVDNPEMFGIVVFTANNLDAAREFMNADPAVQQKIMKAEIHPFSVALLKGKE